MDFTKIALIFVLGLMALFGSKIFDKIGGKINV